MALKFSNDEARLFNALLNSDDHEKALNDAINEVKNVKYLCSDEKADAYREENIKGIQKVKIFFDKIKFFDKPKVYAVNAWGYGQTNYENLFVLGVVGGSVVAVLGSNYSDVYTIQKKKFELKERANIDGVISTKWDPAWSAEDIAEQNLYNAYYGH